MRPEEKRRPEEIEDELRDEGDDRRAPAPGAAAVEHDGDGQRHQYIKHGPGGAEDQAGRDQFRHGERGEPALAIASMRELARKKPKSKEPRQSDAKSDNKT